MSRKAPAFQFYGSDFLMGTAAFTLEERGAYVVLLALSWDLGPLPADPVRLAAMLGVSVDRFQDLWVMVGPKWEKGPSGGLVNARLERTRQEQADYRAAQSKNGRAGAGKRWAGNGGANGGANSDANGGANGDANGQTIATGMANAMANAWPEYSSPSPSPSLTLDLDQERESPTEKTSTAAALASELLRLWNTGTTAPIAQARELTAGRRVKAAARMRDVSADVWRETIARIEASGFCRGENDRGWVADFDWLLQPGTRAKVLEGKYDNRRPATKRPTAAAPGAGREYWADECKRIHGGTCQRALDHGYRMLDERDQA